MNAEQFEDFSESLEQEELPHADERWLVSYADMMTLLFGLFVMLYSMVGRLEDVEKSARQQFAANSTADAAPKEKPDQGLIALEERLRRMQIRSGEMQNTINQLEKSLADERARSQTQAAAVATPAPNPALDNLRKELDEARKERDSLRTEIAMARLGGGDSDGGRRANGHGGAAQPRSANGATSKPQTAPAMAGAPSSSGTENTKVKRGGEMGAPFNFTLEYTALDGTRQSVQIDRLSPDGMQLKEVPQPGPQQRFKAEIKRDDGSSVAVTIMIGREPGGTLASRARIIELSDKSRDEFGNWVSEERQP